MNDLLEAIRAATVADAAPEARAAGAAACRTILAALEAIPGQPIEASPIEPSQIANMVSALRGVPADQLLDLAIAKLRAALPAGAEQPKAQPLRFQFIPKTQLETLGRKAP